MYNILDYADKAHQIKAVMCAVHEHFAFTGKQRELILAEQADQIDRLVALSIECLHETAKGLDKAYDDLLEHQKAVKALKEGVA